MDNQHHNYNRFPKNIESTFINPARKIFLQLPEVNNHKNASDIFNDSIILVVNLHVKNDKLSYMKITELVTEFLENANATMIFEQIKSDDALMLNKMIFYFVYTALTEWRIYLQNEAAELSESALKIFLSRPYVTDRDNGEDIFQDALESVLKNIRNGKYKEQGTMKAYIVKIARFKWLSYCKKKQIILDIDDVAVAEPSEELNIFEDPNEKERQNKAMVEQIKTIVNDKKYKILELYYIKNVKQEVIAKEFNISPNNVKQIIHRAKNKVKNFFGRKTNSTKNKK